MGSKALTESAGLAVSAATVRNDMALLEDLGYIHRPHSSAGGVPTDKGYRWFIDNWPSPAWPELPPGQERAIREAFEGGFRALEEALDTTSQVLSEVTEAVAVVAAPPARQNRLRRLELLCRSDGRLGVLLIADTGLVEQGIVEFPRPADRPETEAWDREGDAQALGGILNAELSGAAFEDLPARIRTGADRDGHRGRIAAEIERMVVGSTWERIYRGGTANILSREKFLDLETAHGVVGALERPMVLAALLKEGQGARAVLVLIGQENPIEQMQGCATVLGSYGAGSALGGTLAVIGPTRMDYPHTISAVNLVVRSLSGLLDDLAN